MDLSNCKNLIVFGGGFDPPHNAHVTLPTVVMRAVGADAVAYVPAAVVPLKRGVEPAPAKHRLAMLRLAVADLPHAVVLTDEIDRAGDPPWRTPSYTVDTLEGLRDRLGDRVAMRLLIGADQLQQFDQWRSAKRIIELAEPVVMLRPPQTRRALLTSLPREYNADEWSARVVDVPQIDVSATMVRRRVAKGEPIDDLVPAAVEQYIRQHRLYEQP
ncbi:MAG: nicotinate (nicotinamide) nucleotide adenylyltransferase [Phycisphaeraceae bacterium]